MSDGQRGPDYDLIEIGAMTSMTVLVNGIKISDRSVMIAYGRLGILEKTLRCAPSDPACPPFQLVMLESMLENTLPFEYQVLGVAAVRLIKSRADRYLDVKLSDSENLEIIRSVAATVVSGMAQALEPRVHQIQSRG